MIGRTMISMPSARRGAVALKLALAAVFIAISGSSAWMFQANNVMPSSQDKGIAAPAPALIPSATAPQTALAKAPETKAPEIRVAQARPIAPQPQVIIPVKPAEGKGSGVGSLAGRILRGNAPVASAKVVLYSDSKTENTALRATTKEDGGFAFAGLKEGLYTIHLEHASDAGFNMMEESLQIAGKMQRDFAFPDKMLDGANASAGLAAFGGRGTKFPMKIPERGGKVGREAPSQAPMAAPGKPAKSDAPEGF